MAQETPYREMDSRGFRHSNSVYEKRLEATMTDIVTYCDVNTCEECPRYGSCFEPISKPIYDYMVGKGGDDE